MGVRFKTFFFFILLFLLFKVGKCEYDCIFEHLSTENGLSNGNVAGMLKDSRGFMWFATWDGLNRYDGHAFRVFKQESAQETNVVSNRIDYIVEDSLGNIWAATSGYHILRFNRFTEKLEPVPKNIEVFGTINITGIKPVSSGDVWLYTSDNGLFRVLTDPITNDFKTIQYSNTSENSIPGNNIKFVSEDAHQNTWIFTDQGIVCYELNAQTRELAAKKFSAPSKKIFNSYVISSFWSEGELVFLGTKAGNLLIYNIVSDNIRVFNFDNQTAITSLLGSLKGNIYLGTNGNGIFEFNIAHVEITHHFINDHLKIVLKDYIDSENQLWLETAQAGVSKIDLNTGKFRHFIQQLDVAPDIRSNGQCGMMEDEQGVFWLTLKGGGFGFFNRETDELEYFFNKPGDPKSKVSNFVKCFYKDKSGVLWMRTYFKGIEKVTFIKKQFRFIQPSPQSNLSIANEVRAMLADSKGYLWVATKKQELYVLDSNLKVVKRINSLNNNSIGMVYAMLEDANGNVYLGTKGNGLFKLARNSALDFSVSHYVNIPEEPTSLSNDRIYALHQDKKGRIWVGTYGGGLNLFTGDAFINQTNILKPYVDNQGMNVRYITEDGGGNLWLGTTDGIILLDTKDKDPANFIFKLFNKESANATGLLSNDIFWIFCDKQNNIWIASLGGGLGLIINYQDTTDVLDIKTYTKLDGLPSDVIYTIIDDEKGNLWMSTENGISFYDTQKGIFKNYGRFDGISNSAFSEAAMAKHLNGSVSFGANNGFYWFNPNAFLNEQNNINVIFTGFQLFGKEVIPGSESVLKQSITETREIALDHTQNVFGITWSGMHYSLDNKIQYAYKLDGFDSEWLIANEQNQATYTKLSPGTYTFHVKYMNPDLGSIDQIVSLKIEIRPPIWRTVWAYLAYLVVSIVLMVLIQRIIITIIRLRNKVVIEQKLTDIKLNFFTNISHELRTPLTLILGPVKSLLSKNELGEKDKVYAHLIEQNTQRLLRLVTQLLDFRKVQSNKMELKLTPTDLVQLTRSVCKYFEELANEKNIEFDFNSTVKNITLPIDEEKMDSVIFNLLSNAFKFTPAKGKIKVVIYEQIAEELINIEVIDNGIGVLKDKVDNLFKVFSSQYTTTQKFAGTGIGLALSKELVQLHNGTLSYRPNQEQGSVFCISLNNSAMQISESFKTDELAMVSEKISTTEIQTQPTDNKAKDDLPRILVVEDNADLRKFLKLQLSDDYQIDEAKNGREGLQKAIKAQPNLILSDLMMPVMDGIQLLDNIKNNFETSHIPVVLLTAKSSVESKIEGLKYGADAYLTKPFNTEQLKAQIENLLYQRVRLRASFGNKNDESEDISDIAITARDTEFLNQVRDIIEVNLTNPTFKVESLYKAMGLGRSTFFDKIKGLTGLSPIDFIKEYRLNKANSLLQTGEYNVSEVSFMSGFSDAGYFSKCYKERFGLPPSEVVKK